MIKRNYELLLYPQIYYIHIFFVLGVNVDGNATMGENIADHGGLKIAEIAYENWLRRNNGQDTLLPALQVQIFEYPTSGGPLTDLQGTSGRPLVDL